MVSLAKMIKSKSSRIPVRKSLGGSKAKSEATAKKEKKDRVALGEISLDQPAAESKV